MSGSKLKFTALLFFSALSAGAPLAPAALASTDKTVSGGTLVGSITCGPDEDKPAARAFVHIDEIGASTSVDGAGRFTIRQVPAARPLTITATSDSGAAATA